MALMMVVDVAHHGDRFSLRIFIKFIGAQHLMEQIANRFGAVGVVAQLDEFIELNGQSSSRETVKRCMREFSRKEEEKDEYSIPEGERKTALR